MRRQRKMAASSSSSGPGGSPAHGPPGSGGGGPYNHRSRFGDTTLTKVFVGGLAWETPSDGLRQHFETYGEILEAVVITDRETGRSKGYGFVSPRRPLLLSPLYLRVARSNRSAARLRLHARAWSCQIDSYQM